MNHPVYRLWNSSIFSGPLAIQGNETNEKQKLISCTSYFCNELLGEQLDKPDILPLAFFCSMHADPADKLHSAGGILRSLISQLVAFYRDILDLGFIEEESLKRIQEFDLHALSDLLKGLLQQVGEKEVFCIVDGISLFESEAGSDDISLLIRLLANLRPRRGKSEKEVLFKLLVTSSAEDEYVRKWIPADRILALPSETAGGE